MFTSHEVLEMFEAAGYLVMHLDNEKLNSARGKILKWDHKTKRAILTAVSLDYGLR